MSKNWYPVINVTLCIDCGTCIDKCKNGVYDKSKYPSPSVINPEKCIDGCYGCGNLCPVEAIEYIGEGNVQPTGCGCGCDK